MVVSVTFWEGAGGGGGAGKGLVEGENQRTGVGGLVHIRINGVSFYSSRDINIRWMLFCSPGWACYGLTILPTIMANGMVWDRHYRATLEAVFPFGSGPFRGSPSTVGMRCLQPDRDE